MRCRRTVSCNSLRCHRPGALLQRFQPAPHVRNGPVAPVVHVSGEQQRWRVSGSSAPAQSSLQPVNAAQAESARGYGVFLGGSAAARPPLAKFGRAERPFRKFGLRSAGCSHTWNSSRTPHDLVQTGAASLSLHNAPTPLPCPPPRPLPFTSPSTDRMRSTNKSELTRRSFNHPEIFTTEQAGCESHMVLLTQSESN